MTVGLAYNMVPFNKSKKRVTSTFFMYSGLAHKMVAFTISKKRVESTFL